MMDGMPTVRTVARSLDLTLPQRARRRAVVATARLYRRLRPLVARHKRIARDAEMASLTGLRLRASGRPEGVCGEHYLSAEAIETFEQRGLLGPFDVLPRDEALKLGEHIVAAHRSGELAEHTMRSKEVVDHFIAEGAFTLDVAGLNQALRMPAFFDLAQHPAIGQRLACLLGDDVLCWRSLFFEKQPGDRGTFWHQNSVFREFGARPKLSPPPHLDLGMAQLTVWVALSDVTSDNGALRILPGTFDDARFEYLYGYALDETLELLAALPPEDLADVVTVALFATSPFNRLQALFDASVAITGRDFAGCDAVSLEMSAGQAVIFTSLNMHASHDNRTETETRLAWVGRYCPGAVRVYEGMSEDAISTSTGRMTFPVDRRGSIQAHGQHSGPNRIAARP